jgi:hypothetical protein
MSEEVMHPTCKRCGKYVFAVDGCKGHDDDGYREDIEQERDR